MGTQDDRNAIQQEHNATQQVDNSRQDHSNADLAALIAALTTAVEVLADRYRRKRIGDGLIAVVVAVMLVTGSFYYFVDLPQRRQESRDNTRDLACYAVQFVEPGLNPTADSLRKKYDCPDFNAETP